MLGSVCKVLCSVNVEVAQQPRCWPTSTEKADGCPSAFANQMENARQRVPASVAVVLRLDAPWEAAQPRAREARPRHPLRPHPSPARARLGRAFLWHEASAHGQGKRATDDSQSAREEGNRRGSAEDFAERGRGFPRRVAQCAVASSASGSFTRGSPRPRLSARSTQSASAVSKSASAARLVSPVPSNPRKPGMRAT